ncbi:MAG: response regulator receiver protein [Comamonadaceae bacterium CG1_02_60_18]|nr:MAG: response regulator receiver protein [Comamonadaceae bacterium CG1_02_60_18]PIQ51867.1 MAG: response regulator receiver protein [Comamonadaceae bacterium CG12_big_fil_rev_8_21_14_0_65_59_15]
MTNEILVIDDDAAVRGAFSLVLGEIGCTVRTAENGLEGIALAQTQRPDLIFLDLKMPGIDGIETMRRLLAHDATLTIYIVTAFSHEFLDKLRAVQSEGLKFQLANKPLTSSQIRHIARSALRTQSLQADEHRILLNLYVVSVNPEIQQFVEQLSAVLASAYQPGFWSLNVVEVLGMPEKALENDVFATPMLVREIPEPVLKLLGNLSKMHSVLAAITAQNGSGAGTIVL